MLVTNEHPLLQQTVAYVTELFTTPVSMTASLFAQRMPLYIQQAYVFTEMKVYGLTILCITPTDRSTPIATLRKHMAYMHKKWGHDMLVICEQLTPYMRTRLIADGIAFVAPGYQCYIPFLGIHAREQFQRSLSRPDTMRPSTQSVVLLWMYEGIENFNTPSLAAKRLGVSRMTLTRAFDELETMLQDCDTCSIHKIGKERRVQVTGSVRQIWTALTDSLRDPVKERHLAVMHPSMQQHYALSGFSALSEHSTLAAPPIPTYAMTRAEYHQACDAGSIVVAADAEEANAEIEIWIYHPRQHNHNAVTADPLSISLSLMTAQMQDERVELAVDDMLHEVFP